MPSPTERSAHKSDFFQLVTFAIIGLMMEGKCLLVVLLAAMAVCTSASPHGTQPAQHWEALKAVAHSNLDFSRALFKVMSKETEGNFFFSPTSIHVILAMTSLGARGDTAQEMVQGLHLPADQQKIKDGFRHLITSFHSNHSVTTKMANKIFTDSRLTPAPEFVQTATNDFQSGNEVVDFASKHEEARVHINSWVMDNTENKIENLLPSNSVDSNTIMVLVNALYFKGAWSKQFQSRDTSPKPFHVNAEVTKDVPMMYMYAMGDFAYSDCETLNAQILEMPYWGHKISMMIILPKEKHGLRDVETRLAGLSFSNLTSRQTSHPNVRLYLPKFKLEHSTDLKTILNKLGIVKMFESNVDLSGLVTETAPIKVSKALHKAFIEVNENGTEAAAATGFTIQAISLREGPPITFKADHPFLFVLVNNERKQGSQENYNNILFMGRYAQPN